MAPVMLSLALTVLCVLDVRADCEQDVIEKIKALWDGNPPYDILSQQVGNQTYLYLPPVFDKEIADGLKCFKTELSLDGVSTRDYHIFKDPSKNKIIYYDMVEETEGVITNINPNFEDQMYVVYFKHGVFAYYQCGEGYDPYFYIAVLNYNEKNLKQTTAVGEATLKVTGLGKTFGIKMNPSDCPDD